MPPPPWWSETESDIGQLDAFKLTDVLLFPAWGAEERAPAHPERGMRFDVERFLDFAFAAAPLAGTRDPASLARRVGLRLGLAR